MLNIPLPRLLAQLRQHQPQAELIVVDDGSTDAAATIAANAGAKVIRHPYPMGNGAAIKTGARAATGDVLIFMDADGQHNPADMARLLEGMESGGYDMVVGMAFFRAGYPVAYIPIKVAKRMGSSHIHLLKDGVRFLLIIFKIGTLYSPLKLFFPFAAVHGLLGLGYYAYTYLSAGRLSLATIFLLSAAVTIFLIGLVSEQITALNYRNTGK